MSFQRLRTQRFQLQNIATILIIIASSLSVHNARSITDISQVTIGNLGKEELDEAVKSVEISEIGSVVPQESFLVEIARDGSRQATRCHTVQGQGAVLRELNLRSSRQVGAKHDIKTLEKTLFRATNIAVSHLLFIRKNGASKCNCRFVS